MIIYVESDLFSSPAKTLVNPVNTVGVMGKGLAKGFKDIYPNMFLEYQTMCETGAFDIGKLYLYKTSNKWILNFPTKKNWRQPSKIEYIEAGLETFVNIYSSEVITDIAFPKIGCGHGELDWDSQVKPVFESYLKKLPIDVFVYYL